jgi:subtilase-type serine protease
MRCRSSHLALSVALTFSVMATTPAHAQQQFMDEEFDAQWGLAAIGAQYALARGLTGAGIGVVVVDSSFQQTHPEFAGRVGPYIYNAIPPGEHGTHVAGIIGAARNGIGMEGVAPGAMLSSIGYFDVNDNQVLSNAQLAVAYQGALDAGLRIFNNSWGVNLTNITDYSPETAEVGAGWLREMASGALRVGSVLVFATGNDGYNNPGLYSGLPYLFPELVPGWISVTSVDETLSRVSDANACGVGAYFCIAAPGEDIYSTVPVSTYDEDGGTSMAAPHVTGAVAIAKQMYPNATNAQLANLVLHTATDIGAPGIDNIFGWGLLSIENLVNTLDPGDDAEDGSDNGALFVNAAFARFAAVDTLVSTLWDRGANRILQQGGAAPTTSVAQAMAPQPIPAMALGGPVRDDTDNSVIVSTGRNAAVWAQGLAAHASIDGSPKASADLGGAIGGYDLFDNGSLSGGIAIAYTRSSLDTHGAGDDSSATGWHGYAYATWQENNWFLDGTIGGNWFDNDYKRTSIGGTEGTVLGNAGLAGYSSNDTQGVSGRVAGGHLYSFRDGALLPYAYVNFIHQKTGGSAEAGADIFSLNVNATTSDQVEGGIGTRAQLYGIAYHGFTISPAVDLAYGRLGGDVALPVGFDLLGSELQANTDIGRNVFRAGAQLDVMRFDELVGGFLAYDGRFQQNAQNNTFSGGILVRF